MASSVSYVLHTANPQSLLRPFAFLSWYSFYDFCWQSSRLEEVVNCLKKWHPSPRQTSHRRQCMLSHFVSNSLQHYGLWPARLLCPWDFPGQNTGVGHQTMLFPFWATKPLHREMQLAPHSRRGCLCLGGEPSSLLLTSGWCSARPSSSSAAGPSSRSGAHGSSECFLRCSGRAGHPWGSDYGGSRSGMFSGWRSTEQGLDHVRTSTLRKQMSGWWWGTPYPFSLCTCLVLGYKTNHCWVRERRTYMQSSRGWHQCDDQWLRCWSYLTKESPCTGDSSQTQCAGWQHTHACTHTHTHTHAHTLPPPAPRGHALLEPCISLSRNVTTLRATGQKAEALKPFPSCCSESHHDRASSNPVSLQP